MQVYNFCRIADVAEGERQTGRWDALWKRGTHVSARAMGKAAEVTGLLPVQFGWLGGAEFGVNHSICCHGAWLVFGMQGRELEVHMHLGEL